jgi:hypothetical protein
MQRIVKAAIPLRSRMGVRSAGRIGKRSFFGLLSNRSMRDAIGFRDRETGNKFGNFRLVENYRGLLA